MRPVEENEERRKGFSNRGQLGGNGWKSEGRRELEREKAHRKDKSARERR